MNSLDRIDVELLNMIQDQFPLTIRPYRTIAEQLDVSEPEIIDRIVRLKKAGLIRRIGAVFDSRHMGYFSTLCACSVPDEQIERVARIINQVPGVTHNYLRDDYLNIWFTLTVPSREEASLILRKLEADTGTQIKTMPAKKLYKIKVSFEMSEGDVL